MDTNGMTKPQIIAAIDEHVSTWLGFKTGLAGLTNKNRAALVWLVQRTETMAQHAKAFNAVKAAHRNDPDFESKFWMEHSNAPADINEAWTHYFAAQAIWDNLWESYDGKR